LVQEIQRQHHRETRGAIQTYVESNQIGGEEVNEQFGKKEIQKVHSCEIDDRDKYDVHEFVERMSVIGVVEGIRSFNNLGEN
jgi:hypothetical protein